MRRGRRGAHARRGTARGEGEREAPAGVGRGRGRGRRGPEGWAGTAAGPRGAPVQAGGHPGRAGARPGGPAAPIVQRPARGPRHPTRFGPARPPPRRCGMGETAGPEGAARKSRSSPGRRGAGPAAWRAAFRRAGRMWRGWGWPCCFPPGEAGGLVLAGHRGGGPSWPAGERPPGRRGAVKVWFRGRHGAWR